MTGRALCFLVLLSLVPGVYGCRDRAVGGHGTVQRSKAFRPQDGSRRAQPRPEGTAIGVGGVVVSIGVDNEFEAHALLHDGRDIVLGAADLRVVRTVDLAGGRPLIPVALPVPGRGVAGVLYRDDFRETPATWSTAWLESREWSWWDREVMFEVEALFYVGQGGQTSHTFALRGGEGERGFCVGRWADVLVASDPAGCRAWSLQDGRLLWDLPEGKLVALGGGVAACLVRTHGESAEPGELFGVDVGDGARLWAVRGIGADCAPLAGVHQGGRDSVVDLGLVQVVGPAFTLDGRACEIVGQPGRMERRMTLPGTEWDERLWDPLRNMVILVEAPSKADLRLSAFVGDSARPLWSRGLCLLLPYSGVPFRYRVHADLIGDAAVLTDNKGGPDRRLAVVDTRNGAVAWRGGYYDPPFAIGGFVWLAEYAGQWELAEALTGYAVDAVQAVATGPLPAAVAVVRDRIYWSPDERSVRVVARPRQEAE